MNRASWRTWPRWASNLIRQSERGHLYAEALARLEAAGLTYECFCTRREIAEAITAPHAPAGTYPRTCRDLTVDEQQARRTERAPAIRLRSTEPNWTVTDLLHGPVTAPIDDFVLRRGDGAFAYNLAVVVDDAAQGVDQVVRGDDLLASAPAQAYLAQALGLPEPTYAHVPLAVNGAGQRLAKRDGAVTLRDLSAPSVWELIGRSLGVRARDLADLLAELDPTDISTEPWVVKT